MSTSETFLPFQVGPPLPLGVASVSVRGLHGKFDYDIDLSDAVGRLGKDDKSLVTVSDDRLTLLFGRNGSGKTSLLRLLFHGLASSAAKGHRSQLAKTRFQSFLVTLTDGSSVSYVRDKDEPIGGCTAAVKRPDRAAVEWNVRSDSEGVVLPGDQQIVLLESGNEYGMPYREMNEEEGFLEALSALRLNPIFLGDSRGIVGDMIDRDSSREQDTIRFPQRRRDDENQRVRDVEKAVELVRGYLTRLALAGAQAGSSKVDSVYIDVTSAIIEHDDAEHDVSGYLIPELVDRVQHVGERVAVLNDYGLLPEFSHTRLAELLTRASEQKGELLQQVLGPYLFGLEQRAEALAPGLAAVSSYIDALNSFLERKTAEFHLGPQRIIIRDSDTGTELTPAELSSGEKQIVLLFSDVIALQDETRLFIIDEPELSLNPEWQRALMPHLLSVTRRSRMQLLAATHSIEILAQYQNRIRSLEL